MLREALEFLAQHRILRGNAHGAGVEVTLPHHDASLAPDPLLAGKLLVE